MNQYVTDMLGYDSDQLQSMGDQVLQQLIHPDDRGNLIRRENRFRDKVENAAFEAEYRLRDRWGTWRWVQSREVVFNRNSDGSARQVLGVIQDITERKTALEALKNSENQLRDAVAAKDKFLSIIAHDLRIPLTSLLGYSDILMELNEMLSPEELNQSARTIHEAAYRLNSLLDNLLEWSRAQLGNLSFHPEKWNLAETVSMAVDLHRSTAEGKGVELLVDVPSELTVYADSNMLHTILRNLISNGIKFSHKGGRVQVRAEPGGERVEVTVADNGVGMSPRKLDELFRIDVTHSTPGTMEESGSGLGLLLCKEFVERHGGTLSVTSTQGQGSAFQFSLSLTTPPGETV